MERVESFALSTVEPRRLWKMGKARTHQLGLNKNTLKRESEYERVRIDEFIIATGIPWRELIFTKLEKISSALLRYTH